MRRTTNHPGPARRRRHGAPTTDPMPLIPAPAALRLAAALMLLPLGLPTASALSAHPSAPLSSSPAPAAVRAASTALGTTTTAAEIRGSAADWAPEDIDGVSCVSLEALRSFYKFTPVQQSGDPAGVQRIGNGSFSISFGPDARDISIQGYRLRLSEPVRRNAAGELMIAKLDLVKLIDPVLRPCYIAGREPVKSVIIDPGHGGLDTGRAGKDIRESDLTLALALELEKLLKQRGYHVELTRRQNIFVSEPQRARSTGKSGGADGASGSIFISLHLNNARSDLSGIRSYATAPAGTSGSSVPGNVHDAANIALAFSLHAALVAGTGAADGGVSRAHYSLLNSVHCPAALIELGNAGNPAECELLNRADYRSRLALALADGIDAYAAAMRPDATLKAGERPGYAPPTTYREAAPAGSESAASSSEESRSRATENTGRSSSSGRSRRSRNRR